MMSTEEVPAENIIKDIVSFLAWTKDLQKQLADINKTMPKGNKFCLYFRGLPSSTYESIPSVYRDNLIENEDIIFKECLCSNSDDFEKDHTAFDKLVKMQHYGIPTRLLDITTNPLVALYFATQKDQKDDQEGIVHVFFVSEKAIRYSDSDTVAIVANMARRPYTQLSTHGADETYKKYLAELRINGPQTKTLFDAFIDKFNNLTAISYLLHDVRGEKPYFLDVANREHVESIWCVKPKLNNNRIIRQSGLFLLFGILQNKQVCLSIPKQDNAIKFINLRRAIRKIKIQTNNEHHYLLNSDLTKLKDFLKLANISEKEIASFLNTIKDKCSEDVIDAVLAKMRATLLQQNEKQKKELFTITTKIRVFNRLIEQLQNKANISEDPNIKKYIAEAKTLSDQIQLNELFARCLKSDAHIIFQTERKIQNKKTLEVELSALGVTPDKLFPELDKVAEYLKKKYAKKASRK